MNKSIVLYVLFFKRRSINNAFSATVVVVWILVNRNLTQGLYLHASVSEYKTHLENNGICLLKITFLLTLIVIIYADDTLLFYSGDFISDIEFHLSQDLNNMINWLENNFLFLNYAKTKVMLVGTHQRLARVTNFSITARNKSLDRVYQFKYLGVILDPCLSWNDHIDYIASKISSRLGMLRKARKIIPRASCITLWSCLCLVIAQRFGVAAE